SAQYSPICVEGVIGYAPAASVDSLSHMIAAVFPSRAMRLPGYFTVGCSFLPNIDVGFTMKELGPSGLFSLLFFIILLIQFIKLGYA
ncbi:MAG TPA: hypothetical protein PKD18_23140, partial [Saprospiraceae bacterium]|nr:hypothetical protein [Saprospiraceae bacterium]